MRKVISAFIALLMLMGSTASIAMAQNDATPAADEGDMSGAAASGETSFAKGLDAEDIYFSERGDEIASLQVVDIERGWQDFGEFYEPDPGVEYVAVTFEVTSISRGNLVVEPYDLSLIDSIGRNNSSSFVEAAEGSDVELLEDDAAVASGESVEFTIVFELFEEAEMGYFMWQPDSGIIIMIDLTEV